MLLEYQFAVVLIIGVVLAALAVWWLWDVDVDVPELTDEDMVLLMAAVACV